MTWWSSAARASNSDLTFSISEYRSPWRCFSSSLFDSWWVCSSLIASRCSAEPCRITWNSSSFLSRRSSVLFRSAMLLVSPPFSWLVLAHLDAQDYGRRGQSCRYGDGQIQGTVSSGHALDANGDGGGASPRSFRYHVRWD